MRSLAVLLGFDAADRLSGGPADGSGVIPAQVDGDDLGGDVDGDDPAGVDAPRAIFCPASMMTPGAAQATGLVSGQRAGPGPQDLRPARLP